jgi:DNA invertase Pin-like site-specific DNA recombinase
LTNTFARVIIKKIKEVIEMANNIEFGYGRVSSEDQNEARQVEKFRELGIEERHVFIDKKSGKDFDREQYKAMKAMLREGDVVYVPSLDRLGRNYKEMGIEWKELTEDKKVDVVVLDMPILDTRNKNDLTGTLISDIVFKLLSYVADRERESIRTRQKEGIAIAKAQGKYQGRKPMDIDKEKFEKLYGEVKRKERTATYAMKQMGVKRTTWYVLVNEYETKTGRFE